MPQATPVRLSVSRLKLSDAEPVLPARSASVAVSVCMPSARPVGVKLHAPAMSVIVVPSRAPPSRMVTPVLASPRPLTAGFEVMLSLDELPVSETKSMIIEDDEEEAAEKAAAFAPVLVKVYV